MSTILKALKRLEQEKEYLRPTGPTPVLSQASSNRGGRFGWLLAPWIRWCVVGCVIVALGGTAFYFYHQSNSRSVSRTNRLAKVAKPIPRVKPQRRPDASATVRIPAAKESTGPAKPNPIAKPANEPPQAEPATRPRSTVAGSDHTRPARAGKTAPVASSSSVPSGQKPVAAINPPRTPGKTIGTSEPGEKQVTASPALPQTIATGRTAPSDSEAMASPARKNEKPSNAYANTSPLADGRLKVHAIAWSPALADRMAVVNSRIVHEGDSIGDFIVVAIRPDDVVVREKERGLWKVVFGRP